jgi:cytochrome c
MRKLLTLFALILLAAGCAGTAPPPSGDAARGQVIFTEGMNGAPPCMTCHLVIEDEQRFSLGPNLAGIGERAGTRVEGLAARDYLHQSIVNPYAYVVGGYRGVMYPEYAERLTEADVADLIAYLMTL